MDELKNEAVSAELLALAEAWESEYSTSANAFRETFPLLAEVLVKLGHDYGEREEGNGSLDVVTITKEALKLFMQSNTFLRTREPK